MRILAGVVLVLAASAAARHIKDDQRDFDFFYLVRQWPGTFCSEHSCPLLKDRDYSRFTIHGLWPNYKDGTWPEFCDKTKPFDAEAIDDLRSDLDETWPSYMDTSNSEDFWAHEWNKHGTCALDEMPSEYRFFKTVLKLNHRYELGSALQRVGIIPSSRREYQKDQILDAVRDAYGVDVLLHCSAEGHLTEVWMCFDKDLDPIDCKSSAQDKAHCPHIIITPIPGGSSRWPEPSKDHHHSHKDKHSHKNKHHVEEEEEKEGRKEEGEEEEGEEHRDSKQHRKGDNHTKKEVKEHHEEEEEEERDDHHTTTDHTKVHDDEEEEEKEEEGHHDHDGDGDDEEEKEEEKEEDGLHDHYEDDVAVQLQQGSNNSKAAREGAVGVLRVGAGAGQAVAQRARDMQEGGSGDSQGGGEDEGEDEDDDEEEGGEHGQGGHGQGGDDEGGGEDDEGGDEEGGDDEDDDEGGHEGHDHKHKGGDDDQGGDEEDDEGHSHHHNTATTASTTSVRDQATQTSSAPVIATSSEATQDDATTSTATTTASAEDQATQTTTDATTQTTTDAATQTSTASTTTTASSEDVRATPSYPRGPTPHAIARTVCIAASGSLLGCIIIVTVISSWSRRLAAQGGAQGGAEEGGVSMRSGPWVLRAAAPGEGLVGRRDGLNDPEAALRRPLLQA